MKARVLLCVRDSTIHTAFTVLLEAEGYHGAVEPTPAQALERLRGRPSDVLLLEVTPEADDMLTALSQEEWGADAPECVLLVGNAVLEPALAAVRAGRAAACLRTPLASLDEILPVIEQCLERRRLRRQIQSLEADLERLRRENSGTAPALDQAVAKGDHDRCWELFDTMEQGVVYQDERGVITAVNPAAERILGRPAGDMLGKDYRSACWRMLDQWGESLAPDRHPSMIALRTGRPVKGAVLGLVGAEGEATRWLKVHAVPCFAPGNPRPVRVYSCFDDVSSLMRVEDALRTSEDRYRALVEAIPQGVEEFALDGTILYANPAHCRMLGYRPGELTGRSIFDLCVSDEARQELRECLTRLVREQPAPSPFRATNRRAEGSVIEVQVDWNYLRDSRARVTGVIAVVSDVARIQQAEQALQESERRYRALVEEAADGICVVARDCRFQAVNPRLCAILGYTREELVGLPVTAVLIAPPWSEAWTGSGRPTVGSEFSGETKARRSNGEVFHLAYSARVLEDGTVQAIVRDVSERKKAESELLRSRDRFQQTVDLMPSILCEIDRDLKVVYFNHAGLETFGYTPADLAAGLPVINLVHPDVREKALRRLKRLRDGGPLSPVEVKLVRRDGGLVYGLVNGAPILNDGEFQGYRISLMDITELKRLSQQLGDAKSFEAIATLAGGIAHQFNNALAVIKGGTELLQMEIREPGKQRNLLDRIDQATDRLAGLTAQLLAYARGGRYLPEVLPAVEMMRRCLDLVGHVISPSVKLEAALPATAPSVEVDLTQLQMVLSAALENASEAMDGSGTITVRLDAEPHWIERDFHGRRDGPYVHLSIEDTGKGMSREEKKRMFDPFFTTKFQGRGLGMAAAYGIVNNHGGWMEVESEPGQGTRLHVFLPMAESPAPVAAAEAAVGAPERVRTILVIDDERALLDIIGEILETLGNRVLTADSGRAALELLDHHQGPIDLALLDLVLMDLPARLVHQRLLERSPSTKVVVCSGYSLDGPAQELLDAGACAFLQKPFTLNDLRRLIQRLFVEELKAS